MTVGKTTKRQLERQQLTTMKIKSLQEIRLNARGLRLAQESDTNIRYEAQADSESFTDANVSISVSKDESTRVNEGVVWNNDANSRSITRDRYVTLPSEISDNAYDGMTMSVADFLRRPVIVNSGSISNTDVATTYPPFTVFQALANASIAEKLKGVYSFRATTVITLQINASRFQQGIYILAFMPMGGLRYDTNQGANFYKMHRFNKTSITQLFHVKFDVGCDTEVQIKIPYVSCLPSFPISSVAPQSCVGVPGVWFMYPYVPLASVTGATFASYTVWSHFEDVELLGNTIPQCGWEAQAGKTSRKGKDLLQEEVDGKRSISNFLKMSASVSDSLSIIPLLSSVATPLSWVLEATSRAAYYWGWSKPIINSDQMRVLREPASYIGNTDGADGAAPLSLTIKNHVAVLPGFGGTDVDEMSIDFIKGKFAWFNTVTWSSGQTDGTVLNVREVAPSVTFQIISTGGVSVTAHTPISYLTTMYKYWRGSLMVRLKAAKTEFHSGRLMVVFAPYDASVVGVPTTSLANSPFTHREIWDLRENSELTIRLPFVSTTSWQETYGFGYAQLSLIVLDALVAPATVPSSITIQMEICGGDDFALAAPVFKARRQVAIVPFTLQSGWEAQVGDDGCESGYTPIGGAVEQSRSYVHEEVCIGEVALSLRQLVKRGGIIDAPEQTTEYPYTYKMFSFPVHVIGIYRGELDLTSGNPTIDPYSYIGACYAQSRGGVRLRILPTTVKTNDVWYTWISFFAKTYSLDWWSYILGSLTDQLQSNVDQLAVHYTDSQIVSVQVPQYSQFINRVVGANMLTHGTPLDTGARASSRMQVVFARLSDTDLRESIWRSGADDFSFGDFVSVPSMASFTIGPS